MNARSAVTMIELLVALGILVIIMLAFSMIITQVQETVSTGQKSIRTNAAAAAIIDTIRNDLRRATRQGMLCITQAADGTPRLIATTTGMTPSKTNPHRGTGGIVALGMCTNQSTKKQEIFFCQRWVLKILSPTDPPVQQPSDILEGWDLAYMQMLNRPGLASFAENLCRTAPQDTEYQAGSSIRIPTRNDDDIGALWQVLAENCRWLSIMWTDGPDPSTGLLNWYGVDYDQNSSDYVVRGVDTDKDPDTKDWIEVDFSPNDFNQIEFNSALDPEVNTYRALWTHHYRGNWPRAIKIRFELVEGEQRKTYEVICPVGG